MALSLDDKLLGEKTHYYCSSSSEGEEEDEDGVKCSNDPNASTKSAEPPPSSGAYNGRCTNTGPKGVVEDWRRFKQFETEQRAEQERERNELAKKLSMTCRSHMDDEREKANDEAFMQILEEQFDEVAELYRNKRLEEMRSTFGAVPSFGKVCELQDASSFLDTVDSAPAAVTVIIHVYEKSLTACSLMNNCFDCLASQYSAVKFCRIRASVANLSINFAVNGLPTILVYKKGELIGNFVRLTDEFGDDIHSSDVESFLIEHGMLPDQRTVAKCIIRGSTATNNDSDSD